jgi:hypothetical protein
MVVTENQITNTLDYNLVQHKEAISTSTLTAFNFPGLDGLNVDEYLMRFDVALPAQTSQIFYIYLNLNNDWTTNYRSNVHIQGWNGTQVHTTFTDIASGAFVIGSSNTAHTAGAFKGWVKFSPQLINDEKVGYVWHGDGMNIESEVQFKYGTGEFYKFTSSGMYISAVAVNQAQLFISGSGMWGTCNLYEHRRDWL